ncbi:MAG TPA: tRNA lysidine(34) synthetase TilS [Pyrinomonadaceae bacterium]|nr:tRNA lysidine(34) synthetase TilS [Pyrinomonadaceae bacterium]
MGARQRKKTRAARTGERDGDGGDGGGFDDNKGGRGRRAVSAFARALLREWRRRGWPESGARVVVAVSGGADSTALLLALDELTKTGRLDVDLVVAHLNHGLRGAHGEEDARWVGELTAALGREAQVGLAEGLASRARRDNLEQAARLARYKFLGEVARAAEAAAVLTAHTLDDQAETFLLRLLRGSGAEGLAGMRTERTLDARGDVALLRPLVAWARRAATEGYCRERGVEFRRDEMNEDERFARVRVRRKVVPLLETFNPRAVEAVARASELLGDDSAALDSAATALLEEARAPSDKTSADVASATVEEATGAWPLSVEVLARAGVAVRRRALRMWVGRGRGDLRRVERAHLLAVEKLLAGERGGRLAELPGGGLVERRRGRLSFRAGRASGKRLKKGSAAI